MPICKNAFIPEDRALRTIRLSPALWGLAASTPGLAQSITRAPVTAVSGPVGHPPVPALLAAALVLSAYAALRKHRVLAALLPVAAASLLVWQSPEL